MLRINLGSVCRMLRSRARLSKARGSESDEIVMIVKQIVVMQTEDARPLILGESKKAGNGNKETNFGNQELHAEEKRGDMFSSRIFICDVDEEEKEGKCGNERHDGGSATAICAFMLNR